MCTTETMSQTRRRNNEQRNEKRLNENIIKYDVLIALDINIMVFEV
jgi:hypothetical protein